MVNMPTHLYSTVMFWTDVQNASEYVTDSNVLHTTVAYTVESTSVKLGNLILSAIFFALIVLANIISLMAFLIEKRLRTYNNYFIINLTILDLLVGIGLGLVLEHSYFAYYPFSQNACKIITGVFNGIVNASNITVVVICADRHQAVYDPINHFISRTKRKAVIINSLPWVIGLSFWIGYVTIWEFVVDHDTGLNCNQRYFLSPWTNMIQSSFMFYLPLLVIAVLYIRIFIKIRKTVGGRMFKKSQELRDDQLSSLSMNVTETTCESVESASKATSFGMFGDNAEKAIQDASVIDPPVPSSRISVNKLEDSDQALPTSTSHRMESTPEMRKATRTLLFIVIAFLLAWVPISVITLIYSIKPSLIYPLLSTPAFLFFANLQYANSLLNPISYTLSQPLFRATVIRMFSCKRGC